jgi:hypothetical protein
MPIQVSTNIAHRAALYVLVNSEDVADPLGKRLDKVQLTASFTKGAYGPVVLVLRIFVLLCVVEIERLLKAAQR